MEHYMYGLFLDGREDPFYLGVGKGPRYLRQNYHRLWQTESVRQYLDIWLSKGADFTVIPIEQKMNKKQALAMKASYIAWLGTFPKGPLINIHGAKGAKPDERGKNLQQRFRRRQIVVPLHG